MKQKTTPRMIHVLFILYSRNEVYDRKWLQIKATSLPAAIQKVARPYEAEIEERAYEGVHAATCLGEDYLVIAADTKAEVRIVHSIVVEQNEGY